MTSFRRFRSGRSIKIVDDKIFQFRKLFNRSKDRPFSQIVMFERFSWIFDYQRPVIWTFLLDGPFSLFKTVHFHDHFDRQVYFNRLLWPSTFPGRSIKVIKTAQFNLKRPSTLDRVKLIHFNLNFKLTRLLANLRELNHGMNQMKNNDQKMLQLLLNKSKNLLASTPSILQFDENIKQEYESY